MDTHILQAVDGQEWGWKVARGQKWEAILCHTKTRQGQKEMIVHNIFYGTCFVILLIMIGGLIWSWVDYYRKDKDK